MDKAVREIHVDLVTETVAQLCIEANTRVGDDVLAALERAIAAEESPLGQDVLRQLLQNHRYAAEAGVPLCQDTGTAVVFLEIGQDVHFTGGGLEEAIHRGIAKGYQEGYLRKSMVADPLVRENTQDNTGIIHLRLVPGDRGRLPWPLGGGSENMSFLKMLPSTRRRTW